MAYKFEKGLNFYYREKYMESLTYRDCEITFDIEKIEGGYRGKGKVYYREEAQTKETEISGDVKETEEAAQDDLIKKFRNFVKIGIAKNLPEEKIAKKSKDIIRRR